MIFDSFSVVWFSMVNNCGEPYRNKFKFIFTSFYKFVVTEYFLPIILLLYYYYYIIILLLCYYIIIILLYYYYYYYIIINTIVHVMTEK